MEVTPTGGVRIRINRVLYLIMLPFYLAATGLYVWVLVQSMNVAPEVWLQWAALGVAGIVLFGGVGLLIAWIVLSANRLVIDDDGFIDQVYGWVGVGRVQWRDVRGTRVVSRLGFKTFVIDVHDPQKFARRGNAVQRSMKAWNRKTFGSPVALALWGWSVRGADVKAIFDRFQDRAMGRGSP